MNILFIKLGAIGDVVQSAVAVKAFRARNPGCRLDWVAGAHTRELVRAFGVADNVIAVDDSGFYKPSLTGKVGALLQAIRVVATRVRYDKVVVAYVDRRYRWIALGVSAREVVSFDRNAARPSPIHHRSRVHEYWRLLSDGDSEPIDIAGVTRSLGDDLLARIGAVKFTFPRPYVVLAAGGAKNQLREDGLRRWPIERYRTVAERLITQGLDIVLVGTESDRWVCGAMEGLPVHDLIGKTSLIDLVPVLHHAEAIVGNDSGVLHLAALTGTGIVGLFGPTPANAFIPLGRARTVALQEGNKVSCCPCYDGKNYAPCSRAVCLEAISVERVLAALASVCGLYKARELELQAPQR